MGKGVEEGRVDFLFRKTEVKLKKTFVEKVEFLKERLFVISSSYLLFKPILESRLSLVLWVTINLKQMMCVSRLSDVLYIYSCWKVSNS